MLVELTDASACVLHKECHGEYLEVAIRNTTTVQRVEPYLHGVCKWLQGELSITVWRGRSGSIYVHVCGI